MARDNDEVFSAALRLPPKGRAALAAALIESLDGDEEPEEDVEAAWSEELQRRIKGAESGEVKAIPWSEARGRILAAARGRDEAG